MQDLGKERYELPLTHRVWVFQSHWPRCLIDVAGRLVPVSLEDAWLPHCHRCFAHLAERAQVQVPRVTGAERECLFL